MKRYREKKADQHMFFIGLKNAFDRVSKEVTGRVLEEKQISSRYIDVIKDT